MRDLARAAAVCVASVALAGGSGLAGGERGERELGMAYAATETALAICPGVILDSALRDARLREAGIDLQQPPSAFSEGIEAAEARSSEAIANERLRSFCLDMLKAYGPEGTDIGGLLRRR